MARLIDQTPAPAEVRPVKIIVISMSRSGTLGTYRALQVLGYKAYHMVEVFANELPDIRFLNEAVDAAWFGKGKRFGRAEFDKWFGNYDAIVELGSFFIEDFLAAYPSTKIIFVERNPDAWVRSWAGTIGKWTTESHRWPLAYLRHFDSYVDQMRTMADNLVHEWTGGKGLTDEGLAYSRQYYVDYCNRVKSLVPPENMLYLRLEDGYGWEQICPYLGHNIPDTPWPLKHNAEEFGQVMIMAMTHGVKRAMTRMMALGAVMVAGVATGLWYWVK